MCYTSSTALSRNSSGASVRSRDSDRDRESVCDSEAAATGAQSMKLAV